MSSRSNRILERVFGKKPIPEDSVVEPPPPRVWIPAYEMPEYLRKAAAGKRAEAEALSRRAETLEKRAELVESALAARAAARESHRRVEGLEHEAEALKARLATVVEEHDRLAAQLARVRHQRDAIPAERTRLETELTDLARQGETPDVLRERYDALRTLAAADGQYEAAAGMLEKELAEKKHQQQELESQLVALQAQIESLPKRREAGSRRDGRPAAPGPISDFERALEFVPQPHRS